MHPFRTQIEVVRTVIEDHREVRQTLVLWVNALEHSIEVEDFVTLLEPGRCTLDWVVTRVLVTLRETDITVPHDLATITSLHRLYEIKR